MNLIMTTKTKLILISAAIVLAGLFLWGRCGKSSIPTVPSPAAVLPKEDREQIVVDPVRHTLIITKPEGTEVLHLPDRRSVIDIRKNGSVNITSPQWGFEARPMLGIVVDKSPRLALGADLAYFKNFNLGLGVAFNTTLSDTRGLAYVSYTVWDNLSLGLTFDHRKTFGGLVNLRI